MSRQIETDSARVFSPLSSTQMNLTLRRLTRENSALNEEVLQLRAAVMMFREVGNRLSLRLA